MNEVRVFDAAGNLKHIISEEELIAISDRQLSRMLSMTGAKRRIKFKWYNCVECKIPFQSNSTSGALYCKDCRKIVHRMRKKNASSK